MAASSSILAEKLHEYPQQDVVDGGGADSAAILDDCLNRKVVCCSCCTVTPGEPSAPWGNVSGWMTNPTIRITWVGQDSMSCGCVVQCQS